eukprot:Phypoly_transcript_08740.p1 GENE.Phypoly_transcript_08740~~Phypoly_transcript_08740.p1  ORF type:complete len:472 (+),score=30.53 Phypoly_transcript_08740:44-1417(+)
MGSNLSQQARDRIYTCRKNGKTELNLSDCALVAFPKVILKFKPLKKITIARNLVPDLPPELSKLVQLEILDVSTNEIQVVPQELHELHNLTSLDLAHNAISQFNIVLPQKLRYLDISSNSITTIGTEFNCPLEELHYQRNKITIFPTQILNIRGLKVLDLCGNRLTYMPDEIEQLALLESLNISENSFNSLPPSLFKLVNIKRLYVGKNQLGSLPQELECLTHLEYLNASSCALKELCFDVEHLPHLVELELRENSIVQFSKSCSVGFEKLTNLRVLDLAYNALVSVPRQIGYLTQLRKLLLNNNNLRGVPGEFHFFPPSIDLAVSSNPLDYPFSQYVMEGIPTLIDHIAPFMKAYASKCTIIEDISFVPAGKPLSAKLIAYDYSGKQRVSGGDEFQGTMVSTDVQSLEVDVFIKNDKSNPGLYDVYFSCAHAGQYSLTITHEEVHIKGSPFIVNAQ